MKKLCSIVLALLLVLSLVPTMAFAEGDFTIRLATEAKDVKADETFTVDMKIENNPSAGLLAVNGDIVYDTSAMKLTEFTVGEAFGVAKGGTLLGTPEMNCFSWDALTGITGDGVFLTMTFTALTDISGVPGVGFDIGSEGIVADGDGNEVAFKMIPTACDHNWTVQSNTEATCEHGGEKVSKCTKCGATTTETTPALPHTEDGNGWYKDNDNHYHKCACGTMIDKAAHTWAVTGTTPATCTVDGHTDYKCNICDATKSETLKAVGHDIVNHAAKAPTCTENGWDAYDTCKKCDYTTYSEKAALGHDIVNHAAKVPTCTEKGWDAYETCSRCDYTTCVEKAALGHDIVNHAAQAPTCTEKGWDAYETCSRCDYTTKVEKAATGHSYPAGSSCTDELECTVCHEKKEAGDHVWNDGEVTTPATCTVDGVKTFTCTICNETKTEAIKASGHDFEHHDAKAPTCTEKGWDAYETCKKCDYTTKVEKAALGHTEVTDEAKAPTCTETGLTEGKHCSVCNEVLVAQQTVEAPGHKYGDWKETKAPTCTEKGEKERVCGVCEFVEKADIDALGHEYGDWKETKAPTCTEKGEKERICDVCQFVEKADIDALGHSFKDGKCSVCNTPDPNFKPADNTKPADPTKPATGDAGVGVWVTLLTVCALFGTAIVVKKRHA